jgi:hypothetical protein
MPFQLSAYKRLVLTLLCLFCFVISYFAVRPPPLKLLTCYISQSPSPSPFWPTCNLKFPLVLFKFPPGLSVPPPPQSAWNICSSRQGKGPPSLGETPRMHLFLGCSTFLQFFPLPAFLGFPPPLYRPWPLLFLVVWLYLDLLFSVMVYVFCLTSRFHCWGVQLGTCPSPQGTCFVSIPPPPRPSLGRRGFVLLSFCSACYAIIPVNKLI